MINDIESEEVNIDFSQERMEQVALGAIGKIPLQDLINDAVSAMIEVYKARPQIYQIDLDEFDESFEPQANPFSDLVLYLKEINQDVSD